MEIAESFADGLVEPNVLRAARLACKGAGGQAAWYAAATNPAIAARNAARSAQARFVSSGAEFLAQAALLRDIFGPVPFRRVVVDSIMLEANDGAIVKLAEAIYEDRNLDGTLDHVRMMELANTLEKAGCTNADMLDHCRQPVPHVRGCWVIDLLLWRALWRKPPEK